MVEGWEGGVADGVCVGVPVGVAVGGVVVGVGLPTVGVGMGVAPDPERLLINTNWSGIRPSMSLK